MLIVHLDCSDDFPWSKVMKQKHYLSVEAHNFPSTSPHPPFAPAMSPYTLPKENFLDCLLSLHLPSLKEQNPQAIQKKDEPHSKGGPHSREM